jgi:hypothetical protein
MEKARSAIAFKEWAAVCEALAAGRQTIILRKGGIHEGCEGFRVEHQSFWLYPTNFHQQKESLTADAYDFVARAAGARIRTGTVPIRQFAQVAAVHELATEQSALRVAGEHIWSAATVRQRFAYRQPGLFLLIVRVSARPYPVEVVETGAMAGCKSWVSLPEPISTEKLIPVLGDDEFRERLTKVEGLLV